MVCTSMHNYPFIKWCLGVGCSSVSSKVAANQIGSQTHESQANRITIEYAIIVRLPYPSLLGYEDQLENEGHYHSITLDT